MNPAIAAHDPKVIGLQLGRLSSGARTSLQALTISGATVATWSGSLTGSPDALCARTLSQFCTEVFDVLDAAGKTSVAAILVSDGTSEDIASSLDRELAAWRTRGGQ